MPDTPRPYSVTPTDRQVPRFPAPPSLPEGTVLYTVWGEAGVRSSDAAWRAAGVETVVLLERVRRG